MLIRKDRGEVKDNRRGRRFNVNWSTHITMANGTVMQTRVTDASTTGLAFVSPMRFPVYENVRMAIEVGPALTFNCVARIVREWGTTGKHFYGVRLLRANEADYKEFTDMLLRVLRQDQELAKPRPGAWREF